LQSTCKHSVLFQILKAMEELLWCCWGFIRRWCPVSIEVDWTS
jgi:hypothetical protein